MSIDGSRDRRPPRLWALVWLAIGAGCASGPGTEFIKAGDDALRAGRASDALAAYDQALEEGATESRLKSRREEAQALLIDEKIAAADRLDAEGDHGGALQLLVEAQGAATPPPPSLAEALTRHSQGWIERAKVQADDDQRAAALRSLSRLEAIYPQAPGLAEARSIIVGEWTEILLNRARDADKQERPAEALLNWAILAALNPEEEFFAAELDPLRQRLMETLSTRAALFLGTMNAQMGLDPDVDRLREVLGQALSSGDLSLPGVTWVERPFGEPGPTVTVSAVGEIGSTDVERGEGKYNVLQSTQEVDNPELLEVDARIREMDQKLTDLSRQLDRYEVSLRHSEGPSRTKMTEAISRAQAEYDRLDAELYDLRQRRQALPARIEQPVYKTYTVEDEVHSHRVEVTLEVRVATGDGAQIQPAYVIGRGEEKDTLRIGDPARDIPDDPLVFSLSDDELRKRAVADALARSREVIAIIPRQAAEQWLAHAQRSERADEDVEATRAYIHHVLLVPGEPAEAAVSWLASLGLPSPSLIRGDRPPLK